MFAPVALLAAAVLAAPVPAPPTEPLPPGAVARLGTTRFRLGDGVGRVTPSPGGQWLVTLSPNLSGTGLPLVVTVLDARTGLRAAGVTVRDGNWWLRSQPAVSGDGQRVVIVAANPDRLRRQHADRWLPPGQREPVTEVRCYDLTTGRVVWRSPVEENALAAARPGGTALAYCSANRVTVADFASGKSAASWECPGGWVWGMGWAADGGELVTVGADRAARVWNPRTGKELRTVPDAVADEHPDDRPRVGQAYPPQPTGGLGVWGLSPDGRWLVSADENSVRLIDLSNGQVALREKYDDGVYEVAVSTDGKTLATVHRDPNTVRLRNTRLGKTWELYAGTKGGYPYRFRKYPTFTPDGGTLLLPWSVAVRSWDADTGRETTPAADFHHTSEEVRFSPDGSQVRTGTRHASIDDLWDARTGRHLKREQHNYAAFRGPLGEWLGVQYTRNGNGVQVYRTDTREFVRELAGKVRLLGWSGFSPDGRRVFVEDDGRLLVWDVGTGRLLLERAHKAPGATLLTGFADRSGRWMVLSEGEALIVMDITAKVERVLVKKASGVSAGGGFVVASVFEADKFRYHVWNMDSGDEIPDPLGPPRGTFEGRLHFAPDGKSVARLTKDGRTVAVHDWPSGALRRKLTGTARTEAIAFSPDGLRMATTQRDTTTLVWDVAPPKWPGDPPPEPR